MVLPRLGWLVKEKKMGTTMTGSGIVLVGYADTIAGIVLCVPCADRNNDSYDMEAIYSPDTCEDTPLCFACGKRLGEPEPEPEPNKCERCGVVLDDDNTKEGVYFTDSSGFRGLGCDDCEDTTPW